jgi:predicted DNA-binding transcriptional regulator AlpA
MNLPFWDGVRKMYRTEPHILTISQAAGIVNVSEGALKKWRQEGSGPKWFRLGKHVRYLETDITDWIDEQYNRSQGKDDQNV